jgi:hypothetical protein
MSSTRKRDIVAAMDHLGTGIGATHNRVVEMGTSSHIVELQNATQDIEKQYTDLQEIYDKLHHAHLNNTNNANRETRRAQRQARLDEVESIVLSASMPNATPKHIQKFAGYDNQDPNCILFN